MHGGQGLTMRYSERMPATPAICVCPADARPDAIRRLHADQAPHRRDELVAALQTAPLDDPAYWEGLLVAGPYHDPTGVVWLQPLAGGVGVLWPPANGLSVAGDLLRAGGDYADRRGLRVVQFLAAAGERVDCEVLSAGGFRELAKLAYLSASAKSFPVEPDLEFQSHAGDQPQRLGRVLEQTYAHTRDCPQLDGVRPAAEVIEGYRQQGDHDPALWYVVRAAGRDVGVLLMTTYPESANWELIYMGVVPQARGNGVGRKIVEFALTAACRSGADQLLLAVDASNQPARDVYASAGFQQWGVRTVFARIAPAAGQPGR